MKNTFVLLSLITFAACNSNADKSPTNEARADSVTQEKIEKHTEDTAKVTDKVIRDSVINIETPSKDKPVSIKIEKRSAPIRCNVSLQKGTKLMAEIATADDKGNIRFNQIIMPDNSADGPFSKELEYDIKNTGIYKLLIGADLMAETPYKGEFTLTISIQ